MAGKAPLLLAVVLFGVGAIGLGLTSAERARWGPFEPHRAPAPEQRVLVYHVAQRMFEPPALFGLLTSATSEVPAATEEPQFYVAAPEATEEPSPPEPTPTPIPPLTVHGISADGGGVAAAANTPPTPPPIRIGGISFDGEPSTETPTPEATGEPAADPAETPIAE